MYAFSHRISVPAVGTAGLAEGSGWLLDIYGQCQESGLH